MTTKPRKCTRCGECCVEQCCVYGIENDDDDICEAFHWKNGKPTCSLHEEIIKIELEVGYPENLLMFGMGCARVFRNFAPLVVIEEFGDSFRDIP